jgi:hypothetical protein
MPWTAWVRSQIRLHQGSLKKIAVYRRTLRRAAITIAVALCMASLAWPQVQGVAIILLLFAIFEYILLTQGNIELVRRQLERQEKVYVNFELICRNEVYVRIANVGISNFLVSAIYVRTQNMDEFHYTTQEIVESGKTAELSLPREIYVGHPLSVDVEITIEVVGLDVRRKSEPQCFNISMAQDGIPDKVKKGFSGLWSLTCPRCNNNFGGLLALSLRGLKTFDDALIRKRVALGDFQDSCPNHASKWLMKMDERVEDRTLNLRSMPECLR